MSPTPRLVVVVLPVDENGSCLVKRSPRGELRALRAVVEPGSSDAGRDADEDDRETAAVELALQRWLSCAANNFMVLLRLPVGDPLSDTTVSLWFVDHLHGTGLGALGARDDIARLSPADSARQLHHAADLLTTLLLMRHASA